MSHPSNSSNRSDSVRHVSIRHSPVRSGKKRFNKKRFWLVIAIIAVAEALAFCLVMQWRYLFPSHEVSEIYTRYENVEGIDVSFIKDFQVNDTVLVDVTILEARTDSAWNKLKKDFKVPVLPKDIEKLADLMSIDVWRSPRSNPYIPINKRSQDDYIVAASRPNKTICVFDTKNDVESRAVSMHQYNTFVK